MALKEFEFGFGKTTQKVSLPEEHILDILEGAPTPACDVEAATLECMRHPIGSKPLTEVVSKGDKICIVCADITRIWNHSDQYVIHIVNELNRGGIPDDDICILFAQGTHREQTPEEDIAVVGEELTHRVKLYQHHCKQMDELVHLLAMVLVELHAMGQLFTDDSDVFFRGLFAVGALCEEDADVIIRDAAAVQFIDDVDDVLIGMVPDAGDVSADDADLVAFGNDFGERLAADRVTHTF